MLFRFRSSPPPATMSMAAAAAFRRTLFSLLSRTLPHPNLHSHPTPPLSLLLPRVAVNVNGNPNRSSDRSLAFFSTRSNAKSSGSGYSPLNDPSPNWSNRPPKETILLDGCDYEHWLVVLEFPEENKPSEEQMVESYVKTLAAVVGSEEEAKEKIYSVCTTTYTGFGALISEELSFKLKGLAGVLWVLPDSYLDVPNKDYGGDLFIDGQVVHRPQFNFRERQQQSRNRPRPRYDRRRETMQVERRDPVMQTAWTQEQNAPPPQQNAVNPQRIPDEEEC